MVKVPFRPPKSLRTDLRLKRCWRDAREPRPPDRLSSPRTPCAGTSNYAAGLSLCAVNVALVDQNEVALGIMGDGSTGDVYVAERGGGAWRLTNAGAERLQVSDGSGLISIDPRGGGPGALRTFGREFAAHVPVLLDSGIDHGGKRPRVAAHRRRDTLGH
jgi:hypothetical protein